jgi:hypothetical protein
MRSSLVVDWGGDDVLSVFKVSEGWFLSAIAALSPSPAGETERGKAREEPPSRRSSSDRCRSVRAAALVLVEHADQIIDR